MTETKIKRKKSQRPKESQGVPEKNNQLEWKAIKHFKPNEFTCKCHGLCDHENSISLELVSKLDEIRNQMGSPIKITSGARCKRHNKKIGGAAYSAHLSVDGVSFAADIYCPDNRFRREFLEKAMPLFPRLGLGKDFIHVDLHPDLPGDVVWVY